MTQERDQVDMDLPVPLNDADNNSPTGLEEIAEMDELTREFKGCSRRICRPGCGHGAKC